uniref:Pyridoxal phosphate phosphatase PHOSPHO2 n=1 Tax=Ceratitis capitata TaxID=7213 RepID=W8BU54_CERCA
MPSRQLIVFDFDETLISVCCMRQLFKFIPSHRRPPMYDVDKKGWIDLANLTFKELHSMGYSATTLCKFIRAVPPVPGIVRLIHYLSNSREPTYDMICISDCYRLLVNDWLESHALSECFTGVYCNPTEINENGELIASSYHCVECPYSPPNLCKRHVMDAFIAMQKQLHIKYDRVVYIGNGKGDFCPVLSLRSCDLMCARQDDVLAEKIKSSKKFKLKPKIYLWNNGLDLLAKLNENKDRIRH